MQQRNLKEQAKRINKKQAKRPFTKNDFEEVLKAVTKPLKKKQAEKESEKT